MTGRTGARGDGKRDQGDRARARRTARRLALAALFEAEFGQRTAAAILERHLGEVQLDASAAAVARRIVASVVAERDAGWSPSRWASRPTPPGRKFRG